MKKLLKFIFVISGVLAVVTAINHLICTMAFAKKENKYIYYKWKYGRIRYIVQGSGKPLLLVHDIDIGGNLSEWEETIETLSKDYKVYAIDLLGFGESDRCDVSYSAYLYINLINDFVKDVISEKVCFVGRGISGAYGVMAYYFDPEFYEKMLLIAPCGVGNANNVPRAKNVWLKWILESPIIGTAIYNILCSKLYIRWVLKEYYYEMKSNVTEDVIDGVYLYAHRDGHHSKYPIASLLNHYLNVSIKHVLPNLKIPLHIVWGDDNQLNPIYNYLEIEELKPGTSLTIFEGSKILPHKERKDEFCKIATDFFGD